MSATDSTPTDLHRMESKMKELLIKFRESRFFWFVVAGAAGFVIGAMFT